jgi:hypothetical protein
MKKKKFNLALSNWRINNALTTLSAHQRGQDTLHDLRRFITGPASGLDLQGMKALQALIQEWSIGRRGFLDTLSMHTSPPKAKKTRLTREQKNDKEDARLGL